MNEAITSAKAKLSRAILPLQTEILTTGQVAKICRVACRTVSGWFDSGRLKGYRMPGSRDRRIYLSDLIEFMKAHEMRVPSELLSPATLVVFAVSECPRREGFLVAADAIALGELIATERIVGALIGDDEGSSAALAAARSIRQRHPDALLVFALSPDVDHAPFESFGNSQIISRPLAVLPPALALPSAERAAG